MRNDDQIYHDKDEVTDVEEPEIPEILPMMAVRDVVIFNYMIIPLFVGRPASVNAIQEALAGDKLLLLVTQKDSTIDEPGKDDIYKVGMVCMIMRTLKLPDGRLKVLVQALHKAQVKKIVQEVPYFTAKVELFPEEKTTEESVETEALMRTVREQTEKILSLKGIVSSELMVILNEIEEPGRLADLVVSNLRLKTAESQQVLETINPIDRLKKVAEGIQGQ